MDNNAIFNLFTKSVLQGLLDKVGGDYRTSWKKDKLLELLCDFVLKTVLNKMSTKQLKVVLAEMKLSETGTKSVLIDRIMDDEQNTESSNIEEEASDVEKEINEVLQLPKTSQKAIFQYFRNSDDFSLAEFQEEYQLEVVFIKLKHFKPSTWSVLGDDLIDFGSDRNNVLRELYVAKGSYGLCFDYLETYDGDVFEGIGKHGPLGTKSIEVYTVNGDETSIRVET